MKKNGRRYRELKKLREESSFSTIKNISQEVSGINIAYLSMSHIVPFNPILYDSFDTRKEYLRRLTGYVKAGGWKRRKYESAELLSYEQIIMGSDEIKEEHGIGFYKYFILLDLIHVLGYDTKEIDEEKIYLLKKKYCLDFSGEKAGVVDMIFKSVCGSDRRLRKLQENRDFLKEAEYIRCIRQNLIFKKKEPFGILVTATMSAGKSTFINAITGKYICLSQNMACTSKIHCIVNKAFEDGYSYEYDHDLVMKAGREELLNDNEENSSDKIVVSTSFKGYLNQERIIVNDSPGVNYSGDREHKAITERLIKGRNYNLLIYVMNATTLGTDDEAQHLDFVKQTIGRTPVLFVVNKIDWFNLEEESIEDTIKRQREYLREHGFRNPLICPVSSKAGYLAKQFGTRQLSKSEERELYNYVDKFEQMNLTEYYKNAFGKIAIEDSDQEEIQLLKTSGIAFVEKIIISLTTGGKVNGTGVRQI